MTPPRLRYPSLILLVGLGLGLLSALMTYNKPLGVSFPMIMLVTIVALTGFAAVEGIDLRFSGLVLATPLMFFAVLYAVRAEPLVRFLNLSGALILLLLFANRMTGKPATEWNVLGYVGSTIETGLLSAFAPFLTVVEAAKRTDLKGQTSASIRRVLIGLAIAIPFLVIFTVLLASADLVFGGVLENLFASLNLGSVVGHLFLTLVFAWLIIGLLTYGLSRLPDGALNWNAPWQPKQAPDDEGAEAAASPRPLIIGMVESGIVLFLIDALFVAFVAVQFTVLFGGEQFLESRGLTYSEYARRGFFELVAVAALSLGLLLVLDFITKREGQGQRRLFVIGSGLMISMNLVMLVSAFTRMQLYEQAFGFTRLRVFTHVFMVWLAFLIIAFIVLLAAQRTRLFATALLIFGMGYAATLNLLNTDLFIVRQNVARYEAGEDLDVAYLGTLSADAVPGLLPLLADYPDEITEEAGPWLLFQWQQADLRERRAGLFSYHVSWQRAYTLLETERDVIETYPVADRFFYDEFEER
ncbi:MAG: DUF4173 domain-containing protein [Chloroflexi bacterium]|nr:DUF4173 domain-containing protein [Chloroflexota bacterium]